MRDRGELGFISLAYVCQCVPAECVRECVCVCVRGGEEGGITHKLQIKTKRQRRQLEEEPGYSQDTVLSHVGMIHNQNVTSQTLVRMCGIIKRQ